MCGADPVKAVQIDAAWVAHRCRVYGENRPKLDKELLWRLCGEQNWRCCYCGIPMTQGATGADRATFEHIVPRIAGGPDIYANLVAACLRCNKARGSKITAEVVEAVSAWEGWD